MEPAPQEGTRPPWREAPSKPVALTSAPWARPPILPPQGMPAAAGGAPPGPSQVPLRPGLTGRPVEEVVKAAPHMPAPAALPAGATAATWRSAEKRIQNQQDLQRFLRSEAAKDFVGFILALNEAVKGKSLADECPVSPAVAGLQAALAQLAAWLDEVPPAPHALRYGNPAFRTWLARVQQAAPRLLAAVLPRDLASAAVELAPYLADAFGNATRIDYGTGHETTFVALLYCLARLGVVQQQDCQALVTRVFVQYLALMRRVQTSYWLEPAGSHGVWGLDDYQFLPFLWGASQLVDHPHIRPQSIHSHETLEGYAEQYLYLAGVQFVKRVKKGPLAETSPMLNDISGVASWSKVNTGMIKMYQVEVLSKVPIMQHFLFGSLLPFQ